MSRSAIYPGSFDPITFGHVDLIKRASKIFDEVVVAIAHNARKETFFNVEERMEMIRQSTGDITNIRVETFEGLVVDYASKNGINVLIRGLRMVSDFEYEFQMALTNRRLNDEIEAVFLMPSERYSFLSSSLVKEAAALGADLTSFVPQCVAKKLNEKLEN